MFFTLCMLDIIVARHQIDAWMSSRLTQLSAPWLPKYCPVHSPASPEGLAGQACGGVWPIHLVTV